MLHSAIYSTFNGFFLFAGGEKTKKKLQRGGGAAGAAGPGGEGTGMLEAVRR